jgi:hypothetical protein
MKIKIKRHVTNQISVHDESDQLLFVSNIGGSQNLIGRRSDGSLVGIRIDDEMLTTYHPVGRQVRPSPSWPLFSRPKITQ